jgi:asparagine synthase (glutamine-hydrolysing)
MMMRSVRRVVRRFREARRDRRLMGLASADPATADVIRRVRDRKLTYLKEDALWDLALAAREAETRDLPGIFLEAGCALGGSALVIAHGKRPERPFFVYDVFGTIPPPSEGDLQDSWERYRLIASGQAVGIGGDPYYGYESDLYSKVVASFREFGLDPEAREIRFVRGLYEETLRIDSDVALAHVDCDWYDSVMTCLQRIVPRLVVGGRLVIDDYDAWAGCRKAVDEYFGGGRKDAYHFVRKSRLHVIRAA